MIFTKRLKVKSYFSGIKDSLSESKITKQRS